MKINFKYTVSAVLLLILPALYCSSFNTIPDEGTKEADLYSNKCGSCHSLPHPSRHTYAQWDHTMSLMEMRMNENNFNPLNEEEKKMILEYLKKHARRR